MKETNNPNGCQLQQAGAKHGKHWLAVWKSHECFSQSQSLLSQCRPAYPPLQMHIKPSLFFTSAHRPSFLQGFGKQLLLTAGKLKGIIKYWLTRCFSSNIVTATTNFLPSHVLPKNPCLQSQWKLSVFGVHVPLFLHGDEWQKLNSKVKHDISHERDKVFLSTGVFPNS